MARNYSKMAWKDLIKEASSKGVFRPGMKRHQVEKALAGGKTTRRRKSKGSSCGCKGAGGPYPDEHHPIFNSLALQ